MVSGTARVCARSARRRALSRRAGAAWFRGRDAKRRVDAALIERFSPPGTILCMHNDTMTPPDVNWQERALCAQTGADFFFPEPGSSVREAKRICGMCEMRPACLDYALTNDERFGVWGGLSEKERLSLRRADPS
ncbi:hypothetical protein SGFS_027150 [Streptomyces graminofaciens]|uniref:Transcriptional regulator WhiB n=2 Tax=Streptomyces graminofaciens TaxID=68212 RepID=A0ABM7F692_9ACTN|nr:hypothetical protein SGFS_027150 [Streptomyces graminofaciens]